MTRRLLVLVLLAAPLPALGQPLIRDQGVSLGRPWEIDFTGAGITCTAPSFTKVSCDVTSGGGGGAPTGALYLVGAADATLSAEIVVSPLTDDIVMVANGSTWQTKVLPDCDLVTQKITYDTATNAFACSSSITASDLSCTTCLTVGSEVSTTAERDSFFRVRASDTTSGDTLHDSPRLGMTGEYWASTVSVPHTWEAWNDMTGSATGTLTFTWGGTNHVTTINQAGAVTAGDFVCSAGNCIGSADVAGLDVGDITTGTLGQARGGTGVGALTCTSGQALVSNGTSYSCTSTITASDLVAGSGVVADSELASNYSGIGTCGSNTWASTLNDAAAPTCTQPAFSNLSRTVAISQGGTTETASTEDAVLVGSGTTDWQPRTVPSCSNATTSKLLYDNSTNTFSCGTDQTSGGGAYGTIQEEGSSLTQRSTLNFVGNEITCADDAGNTRTNCTHDSRQRRYVLQSDLSTNSNSVWQQIFQDTSFPHVNGQKYNVRVFVLQHTNASTTGHRYQLAFGTAQTRVACAMIYASGAATVGMISSGAAGTSSASLLPTAGPGNSGLVYSDIINCTFTSSGSGSISFSHQSEVTAQVDVYAGTEMIISW
jgi:hypothetical protein